ncbi:MAG: beta-lactamase family protein [Bacteroidetes bacterium]|nr:beta-lactamase family protein [Bacteroidota bacterium]
MRIVFWIALGILLCLVLLSLSGNNFNVDQLFNAGKLKLIDTIRIQSHEKEIYVEQKHDLFTRETLADFEGFIKSGLKNRQAAGAAVAIVKDTSIIFLKGFGLREIGKPDSVNERTVFRIGSVSKSMTATLAATLVRDSLFQWDDLLINYLPDFRLKTESATKKLKLRHILSHTEGLPYHAYTIMVEKRTPTDTLIEYLKDLDLIAEPGKIYSYQNVGFSLIGKVMEKISNDHFENLLQKNLFGPLGMRDASASFEKISLNGNVAQPHFLTRPLSISDTYYSVAPAGGINASAQDMALWLKALLGNNPKVLPEKNLDQIFEPQVHAVMRNYYFRKWKPVRKSFYALGWRVITFTDGDSIIYHGGYVNNYRCEVAIDRKKKIGIAVLVNSPGMIADQAIPHFFKEYEYYLQLNEKLKNKSL